MTMTTTVNPRVAARAVGESPWRYFRKVFVATLNVAVMSIAVMMVIVSFATHEVAPGDYETFGHPVLSMLSGSMTPVIFASNSRPKFLRTNSFSRSSTAPRSASSARRCAALTLALRARGLAADSSDVGTRGFLVRIRTRGE